MIRILCDAFRVGFSRSPLDFYAYLCWRQRTKGVLLIARVAENKPSIPDTGNAGVGIYPHR